MRADLSVPPPGRYRSPLRRVGTAGPLLQAHGDGARGVPFELGRERFDAANEPKRFERVAGVGHTNPPTAGYKDALWYFLRSLPDRH